MQATNSGHQYGWVAIAFHWLMAPAIIANFTLGWWMRRLPYQDHWYHQAPQIHKDIGVLLFCLLLLRILWRWGNQNPRLEPAPRWELRAARISHRLTYILLLAIMLSGYLIATADGRSIDVFGWFSVPATLYGIEGQEDIAGEVHEFLAWTLITLVAVHAGAALKHHFYNRDATFLKILGRAEKG